MTEDQRIPSLLCVDSFPDTLSHRCERLGLFQDSLYYLQEMLPYIAATGHNLYTTDLWLYLQLMQDLKTERPVLYTKFEEGLATLRRTDKQFGGIPSDQIIEQMLMRALKTRGGLTQGRGFTEVQQAVWLMSRSVCAEVNHFVHEELLQLSGGTSDQHTRIGRTSAARNEKDYLETLEFLSSRDPFKISHEDLENVVTGKHAGPSVNIHRAKEVGLAMLQKMEGQLINSWTFKRKEQAVNMGAKVKLKNGTLIQIDPQHLFDRLIALALVMSLENKTDLAEMMSHELAIFPPALFESEELMRAALKPQITELFKRHCTPTTVDEAPRLTGVVVLDGGSLLYTINWVKNSKFQQVAALYTKYVKKHFLLPGCSVQVVFDSYPATPTIKDSTHLRRTRNACTKIRVADDTVLDVAKQQFLSNPENKQGFVSYVADKLDEVTGIVCSKADDDADCLIVLTALAALEENPGKTVTVVGDDTDLIVLLLHHTRNSSISPGQLFFRTKKWNWDLSLLIDSVKGLPFLQHSILSLHANSGCDTTSRSFGKGKMKFFGVSEDDEAYWDAIDLFEDPTASKMEIAAAGRRILVTVYSTAEEQKLKLDLNQLRAARYTDKSLKAASVITAESLPPTSDAADLHALRAFLQVQQWMGNHLDPAGYGFHLVNGMFLPITMTKPVAPDFLLESIFCGCKGTCDTNICKCHKAQLHCNQNCGACEGISCNNTEPQKVNPFDEDG